MGVTGGPRTALVMGGDVMGCWVAAGGKLQVASVALCRSCAC